MEYQPKKILSEFNRLMTNVRSAVPGSYDALIAEKHAALKSGKIPEKTKWLMLLVAGVSLKCPVCIPRAVEHCLTLGWSREEMLEACMVAVLVGGSSVMTYVTFVEKAIEDLKG
ncbi:MAG: carboxymuconolactone decarboxylase family protein [Candidatus Omnitrophota bacterium]|jgi:alkylhydroperoxidase/carboxymuconolactone decarboxylase family protein YurZ